MLELAILGLLMDHDLHGYDIRGQIRDRLGLFSNTSFGAIYPALNRLEREGLIESVTATVAKVSSVATGSLSGERAAMRARRGAVALGRRGRKAYRITDLGRREFAERLSDPATMDDTRNFTVRMALARFLTPSVRVGLLEYRRTSLQQRLREITSTLNDASLDSYARSVMEHAARGVELDLKWISDLLARESSSDITTPTLAQEAN